MWLGQGRDFVCPQGHFCPAGMVNLEDGRCPRGTFSNHTGLSSMAQCFACPPGQFCSDVGLFEPSGDCHPGFFCREGAADGMSLRCDNRSTVCDTPTCEDLTSVTPGQTCGGECPSGSFCPPGSFQPTPCDPGYYCATDGLWNVTDQCHGGYVCTGAGGASPTPGPADNGRGPCPAGYHPTPSFYATP
jgi:hypothetical protein